MRFLAWACVVAGAVALSSVRADDAADLKKADLPADPKGLVEYFQKRSLEKGRKPLGSGVIAAAVRTLAASKEPERFKAPWSYAVATTDLAEREEICAAIADDDRRHAAPRFLLETLASDQAVSAELAAYAVARYFEPKYRDDAMRASRHGAARGLLGPYFLESLREAQTPAKETLVKNGIAREEDFRQESLAKAMILPGMDYLKRRTPTPLETTGIKAAIAKLGDADFREREKAATQLCAAGEPAIPFLRAIENDDDAEVRLRARRCLKEIDRRQIPDGTLAAIRVIAWNASPTNSENALRQLLDYAPYIEAKEVEELLLPAVAFICIRNGGVPAAIEAACRSELPAQRAIGLWVRGKIDELAANECLGCDDANPLVRMRAAQGLVFAEVRDGVDRLIRAIPEVDPSHLAEIEDMLVALAGDGAPNLPFVNATIADRVKAKDVWLKWSAKKGSALDLASLRREQPFEGIITICENEIGVPGKNGGSRVWQRGRDGRERWTIGNFQGAGSFDLLRNGNVIVGETRTRRVVERDAKGNDLWDYRVNGQPIRVKRLPNGNTFIATNNQLLEISPDKNVVLSHNLPPGLFIYSADRTADGRVVCMTSRGGIMEFDATTGAELRSIPLQGATAGMTAVHAYAKDRYLVAIPHQNNGQVIEVDEKGKILWQTPFKGAFRAQKLPTGNVVVSTYSDRKVAEIDRNGRIIWETTCNGQPTGISAR